MQMKRFLTIAMIGLVCTVVHAGQFRVALEESTQNGVTYSSFTSPSLGREMRFAIQLPPSYERDTKRRYPVLYFLHGMNGSEIEFERRGVAATVEGLRTAGKIGDFIIVAPGGDNSFYVNAKNGLRYEDAIINDLVPYIEKTYRAIGSAQARAIQGISMGGFGALMIAFKHPQMFSSVSAHSAALFAELPKPSGDDRRSQFLSRLIGNIFGNPPDNEFYQSNNPIHLAEANAAAIKKSGLKIYFDIGEQDRYEPIFGFKTNNQLLDRRLTGAGIPHEFHIFPGGHGWDYMLSVADRSYEFVWKNFNVGRAQRVTQ
jgi:S-formylglutathione hydrolase FrmB